MACFNLLGQVPSPGLEIVDPCLHCEEIESHLVDLNYIAFSKAVWEKLTPEQQATVQKAADDAAELGRQRQLALEDELVQFFKDQGMEVYEPDVKAFREHVQKAYLESDFAKDWIPGMVDKINALGN